MTASPSSEIKSSRLPFNWSLIGNYLFILPALGMFLTFSLYPFVDVFYLSLFDWDGISPEKTFVWFGNFKDIILSDTAYWVSFRNAAYVTVLTLTLQNFLALVLAWIVDRGVKGAQAYRSIYFLPPIISGIVVGLIWYWIFQPDYGFLNNFLSQIGAEDLRRAWFADPNTALPALGGCSHVERIWVGVHHSPRWITRYSQRII